MINRVLNTLYRETSGLHEAAFLLAGFALLSKIIALARDRLLAHTFGAGIDLDIYYAAFRIPDFIFISLGTLVASAVLIPFFVTRIDDPEDARRFLDGIFTIFFGSILLVSAVAYLFMPQLVFLVAPGFTASAHDALVPLSRIMLISPILLGLSGLFASVTQTLRRFFVYAISPILYNVGIVIGIVILYPFFGLPGLAYGVALGSLFHVLIQIPVLIRERFFPRISFAVNFKEIRDVLLLSLPRTLTLSASHLVMFVFVAAASFMEEGSITIFNLSFNLQSVPLSIIGISYSVAAFPTLARFFSKGDHEAFARQILSALRHVIFWSFPALVLLIVLRAQIVRVVLGTGEFGWPETRLTAAALALFSVSLIAQSVILLLVRGYYAAGRTRTPLFINVASSGLILALGFLLVFAFRNFEPLRYFMEALLRVDDIAGSELIMLPLAFSIGALVNIFALWRFFQKDFSISSAPLRRTFRQSFFASVGMGFAAHQFLRVFDNIFDINTFIGIFLQGLFAGLLGVVAGIFILKVVGNQEIKEIENSLRRKFWRAKPIAPDQSEL